MFIELSRYMFTILMCFFVFSSVCGLATRDGGTRRATETLQVVILFVTHFLGYLILYVSTENNGFLGLYMAQLLFFMLFIALYAGLYPKASRGLVNNMCMLMAVGFVMLGRLDFDKCLRQTMFAIAGALVSLAVPWLLKRVRVFRNLSYLYLVLGLLPLAVLLISDEVFGAKLAITLGNFSLQPAEFVKIIYVLFIGAMFYKSTSFGRVVATSFFAALHVIILVLSTDLGAALIFFIVYVMMLFAATKQWLYLIAGFILGAGACCAAYRLFAHVRVRVTVWLNPWDYIEDRGYQIAQSLFSIGTGSWFGTGLCQGSPGMIPVPEKDFIFSAICEEFGAVFAIGIIIICFVNLLLILNIALMCKTYFYRYVALGLGVTYAFQVFLTIGGGIKLIPMTGVTLPFVSYGGSSLTSSILMFALINGMYIMREKDTSGAAKAKGRRKKSKAGKSKADVDVSTTRVLDRGTVTIEVIFGILFAMLIGYLVYFDYKLAPDVLNNSYNTRISANEQKVSRGSILASNGSVLAYTQVDDSGAEERVYPYGKVFSHVVGMSTRGKTGIEGLCNTWLTRSDSSVVKNAYAQLSGSRLAGNNVQTTLDVQLQKAAYLAMENNKGAIVVMEPSTGKVLAMVSKPDYNPNDAIDQWEDWLSYDSSDSVLLNRATQGLYPPGSTFKILTAIEYIRENNDFESFRYSCSGSTTHYTSTIHCYNSTAHGYETLTKAFANSCNSAFADIGLEIDCDSLNSLAGDFLFNTEIPIGIESSNSSFTLQGNSSVGEKMQTTIGQGKTQITPLHNAIIASTIANSGVMMKPYLVEKVMSADNKVIETYEPESLGQVITEEEAQALTGFMEEVTASGTGRSFRSTEYKVAGKTGTAQFDETSEDDHSWFVGFAPAENPEIVVSVVLEGGYSGYDSAQEVAKKVMDAYFTK
jgi:peptidoglycan glycosyltransferase